MGKHGGMAELAFETKTPRDDASRKAQKLSELLEPFPRSGCAGGTGEQGSAFGCPEGEWPSPLRP